jgi:predicted nucleotidyltransferase
LNGILGYNAGMNRTQVLQSLKDRTAAIRAMGATSLYVFGSTARDEAGRDSDLDVFIDYDINGRFNAFDLVGIKQFLEQELGVDVDVTTRDGLHPMLRADIERSAVRVF